MLRRGFFCSLFALQSFLRTTSYHFVISAKFAFALTSPPSLKPSPIVILIFQIPSSTQILDFIHATENGSHKITTYSNAVCSGNQDTALTSHYLTPTTVVERSTLIILASYRYDCLDRYGTFEAKCTPRRDPKIL